MSETPREADTPDEEDPKRARLRAALRVALLVAAIGGLAALIFNVDLTPNLAHLDVGILSGSPEGHYHETVDAIARRATAERGRLRNLESAGSMENLSRLLASGCEAEFGLVQDGLDWEEAGERAYDRLQLAARLPDPEMLIMLRRSETEIHDFRDLRGLRIGAGAEGSGTAVVMRNLFALPSFDQLGVSLVHGSSAEQVAAVRAGELDLAAMVVFPDAPIVARAVREGGLTPASFSSAEAVARHLHGARAGILPAGHFDAVRGLPATDVEVLTIDTLLVAGPCARRSDVNATLALLSQELPGFIAHNRQVPPPAHTTHSDVATEFYDNYGPPLVDQYLPWVVDVVPLSNVMTLIMAISVLFNVMSFLNRFRLWRLDARRHKIEDELKELFGGGITRKEIAQLDPSQVLTDPEARAELDALIARLAELLALCRRYATSVLVPMGQEMVYRYQENLVLELIALLRNFQRRQSAAADASD